MGQQGTPSIVDSLMRGLVLSNVSVNGVLMLRDYLARLRTLYQGVFCLPVA